MIDSTNPRSLADNIRILLKKVNSIVPGTVVEGNPSGTGFNTLLTKIKIGSHKYKLPSDVVANPEGEATGSLSKIGIGDGIFSVESIPAYSDIKFDTGKRYDNKIVYGIVIAGTMASASTSKKVSVPNSLTNVDKILHVDFSIDDSGVWKYLPYLDYASNFQWGYCVAAKADHTVITDIERSDTGSRTFSYYLYIEFIEITE